MKQEFRCSIALTGKVDRSKTAFHCLESSAECIVSTEKSWEAFLEE